MPTKLASSTLGAWFIGVLEVLLAMAVVISVLSMPSVFRVLYPLLAVSDHPQDAESIVRWLSSGHRQRSLLLAMTEGTLTPKELRHYSDVRQVLRKVPYATAGLALLAVLYLAAFKPSLNTLAAAQWRGLVLWCGLVLLAGGLGWWDWKVFFAWLHAPFFGDRSWRLPKNSYSLILFPAWFWRAAIGSVMLGPILLFGLAGLGIKRRRAQLVSSSIASSDQRAHASRDKVQ